jgi:hypothetical protein
LPGLAADIGELFALRVNVDQLDLIDNPIAPSQQAPPGGRSFSFHTECDSRHSIKLGRRLQAQSEMTGSVPKL